MLRQTFSSLVLIGILSVLADAASADSIRFFGTGSNDDDRVKIRVDGPATPADIGSTDFTFEFWLRAEAGNNSGAVTCGAGQYSWISGNIVIDRDRLGGTGRDYGLALHGGGRIAFGVENGNGAYTICSTLFVSVGNWHHIAVQRRVSDGMIWLFIDGILQSQEQGPSGDISYPNGGTSDPLEPFLVLGAEKFDLGPPGFNGFIDELRLSTTLRYPTNGSGFVVPAQAFVTDGNTVGLYHFDTGMGNTIVDSSTGLSNGELRPPAARNPASPFSQANPGVLQLSSNVYSAGEAAGNVGIQVDRVGGTVGAASVDLVSQDQSATAGVDYLAVNTTLNWTDGDGTSRNVNITILEDGDIEGDETFQASLVNAIGAGTGNPAAAVVTILDNDQSAGSVQLSNSLYSAGESAGNATIQVDRVGGTAGAASVDLASQAQTASAGSDYQDVSTTLNWNDGDGASQTVDIAILDDNLFEGGETLQVSLSNANGAVLGAPIAATVTIVDDDQNPPPPPPPATNSGGGALEYSTIAMLILFSGVAALRQPLQAGRRFQPDAKA